MFVCLCKRVTDSQIIQAVQDGCDSLRKIRCCTGAMTQCGKCAKTCKEILASTNVYDNAEEFSAIPS